MFGMGMSSHWVVLRRRRYDYEEVFFGMMVVQISRIVMTIVVNNLVNGDG